MSHELRTPMNAILGYSRLLRDTGLPAAEQDLARRIVEASDHLLELINGVVEFSRLDEGQVEVQETDFPPLSLLTEASRRACQTAAGKGLVCKFEVDAALPAALRGDAGLITRILAQFAENAVKFTLHGGVRLRAKRIGDSDDGRIKLRFLVEDSGIGIAPVDQARLFKPFSQLDDRPDRQFEGIGLGLALTHRWAGILGGTVGVDSAPGKGSRFWLELTLAAGNDTVTAEPVKPAEPVKVAKAEAVAAPLPAAELPTDMLSRLAQIESLLNAFDTRAGTVLHEAAPLLRRYLGAQVDELERLIAAFDYDQALERLKSFSQQGKTTP